MTDRGQNINKRPNIVYVSIDGAKEWIPLYMFVDVSSTHIYGRFRKDDDRESFMSYLCLSVPSAKYLLF